MPVRSVPERAVLVAPDAFKGTLRAPEVAAAVGRGLERAGCVPPDLCPVADGGEGTLEVLLPVLGGDVVGVSAHDPLGRPVSASIGLVEGGGTALVELASVSGLGLVFEEERDPWAASSYGTGELIAAAVARGAAVVVVGAGGSATTDGGRGAIEAIEEHGGLGGARLVVLCDTRLPFERAAEVFSPQKGADPAMVRRLAARLHSFAATLPRDPRGIAMTAPAGGLAGGLWARYDAVLEPGPGFVLDALGFGARMRAARAVVIGEGRLDPTSLQGKVTGEIATRARQAGVPCHAIVGHNALDLFDARILDLQAVLEGSTAAQLEAAGESLAAFL
ncbi:MAG TPA: glycerate kinase [Solirubrobacteraceae bacterium]|nr:glycerate kinase [Solirubrobacteraceae bacterium]